MKLLNEGGRLAFSSAPKASEWLDFDFKTHLFGIAEPIILDHVAITLADMGTLNLYLDDLAQAGAQVEYPKIWPDAFCPATKFPEDLRMHFATALTPSGGTVVIAAPAQPLDQLDRFRRERGGDHAIHHVAALVDDPASAAATWINHGFRPLTPPLVDSDLTQQFFINHSSQIVELIQRRGSVGNFSCTNLSRLRAAED